MARLIDSILGHEKVWAHLNSLKALPHALAFTGPSGIGKQKVAWALAQKLVCVSEISTEEGTRPCGNCGPCRRVEAHQSESVLFIEPSGAHIKLEAAHSVLEFLSLGRLSQARIVIINEAHHLNPQAANALLKVVEEPPPQTHFLIIVPEISQLLPTLRSRAQVIRFAPLSLGALRQGDDSIEDWMLNSARGSFERLETFRDEDLIELRACTFEFLQGAFKGERSKLQRLLETTKDRERAQIAVRFLQQALRDWTVVGEGTLMHADQIKTLSSLPNVESFQKLQLWTMAQKMEQDLLQNVDRALVFENFYYRSQNVLD